tara:strand:- start:7639 stop:9960 length:2322 start_codon:yes stop_codon:yes gene_type:complete
MTYQEIKDRLAKCEFSLKCIADGTYKKIKKEKLSETTKKLTILKESLQKQLKEAEGTVRTADSGEAEKLSKKGVDVDLVEPGDLETNEQEGTSFGQNETAKIAAEVGKATVLALKAEGENISTAKAKRIKPNQFDLLIGFNNGNENLYEFYIVGDTLYLKDTSYDREISDVGVQQSGEAIINVDVVKDQLQKYFKTVNTALGEAERVKKVGEMTDQEFADAQEKDRLEKHPEKDIIKKIQFLIQKERQKRKNEAFPYPPKQKPGKGIQGNWDYGGEDSSPGMEEGEGDDRHYIKVPRAQYKKAQKVIDDVLRNDVYGGHKLDIVDNDGGGNVIFYFMGPEEKAITYDAIVYLRNSDIDVADSSISDMEEGDGMTTKIKLSAGDPTNMAYTDKVSENADQDEALDRLREIVGRVEEFGEEARDIVRQNFPNELSRMDGYGVFNMVYSSNRYDTTLGSEVDRLEDYGYDDLDDEDYPNEALDSDLPKGKHSIAKLQKVHGMIVDKMKELAKLYKEKGGEHEYRGHSVIDHLKSLNRKKKQVEDALDKAVANKNRGQQLDPNIDEGDLVSITDGQYAYIKGIIDILKTGEIPKDIEYRKEAIKALASLLRNPGSIKEGTDLYDGDKFSMKRFSGPNGIALQVTARKLRGGGFEYIQIDGDDVKEFARAAVHVAQEFHDIDRQTTVNENVKKYRLGDMYSNDFDYLGMLKAGLKATLGSSVDKLQKLYNSFEDVNYHSENQYLGALIDALQSGDKDEAKKHLLKFRSAIKGTLKTMQ